MTTVKINGGKPLSGEITIEANKNAVLPALCATLLTKETCTLRNIPKSPDVDKILQAIKELGGTFHWETKKRTVTVNCKNVQSKPVADCVSDIQSAILFAGPLLARFGEADIPVAVGCKLGYRGPEDHIYFLSKLGVHCEVRDKRVCFSFDKSTVQNHSLVQSSIETTIKRFIFSEASVTPTENLLMLLSAVTKFDVSVEGVAHEPHVECLTHILRMMGMTIDGRGNTLITKGNHGAMKGFEFDFLQEPDHVDFYGTAVMVALTKGDVFLKCMPTYAIQHMVEFLRNTGVVCEIVQEGVIVTGSKSIYTPVSGFSKADDATWKINPKPWPGFPVDCLPSCIVWASANSVEGTATTINNWMYEDGLGYVHQLKTLGAQVTIYPTEFGAQKITIYGTPGKQYLEEMKGVNVVIDGVPVIEGVRALITAALARNGKTVIRDISPILRRSPHFIQKYCDLGADIKILS